MPQKTMDCVSDIRKIFIPINVCLSCGHFSCGFNACPKCHSEILHEIPVEHKVNSINDYKISCRRGGEK